jgi:hypothetical protein
MPYAFIVLWWFGCEPYAAFSSAYLVTYPIVSDISMLIEVLFIGGLKLNTVKKLSNQTKT